MPIIKPAAGQVANLLQRIFVERLRAGTPQSALADSCCTARGDVLLDSKIA